MHVYAYVKKKVVIFIHKCSLVCFICRVIDKSMKNFKAFFRWLYVGKNYTFILMTIYFYV